ncbi:MAG: aspartate-semialdehyde dehydrogenase [Chloroflexota bacterium]|nr:aspartate-semialdehyde dehydrogenase [Chloroflexota bacterium]
MVRVAFVGWRGMVGSVLMDRMRAEKDFKGFDAVFFTTSQVGQKGPDVGLSIPPLMDAYDVKALSQADVVVTCQGGEYTKKVYPEIRAAGWKGYWIDAASALRMNDDSVIVLDPVNRDVIDRALDSGIKDYIGGNCTVSLMLMGIGGLFRRGWIEWMTTMTYQAASGAGANNMRELAAQMAAIGAASADLLDDPAASALDIDRRVLETLHGEDFPTKYFGAPLAASLIPWIDSAMESGQTREEWKGYAETNKILGVDKPIPIDGLCVRVGSMRCHSQAMTIKLVKDIPLDEIIASIAGANEWVKVVANNKEDTLKHLTPSAVSGTLTVSVGRIRKLNLGGEYLTLLTLGDQLLWGAAEPIRRILRIVLDYFG